MANAFKHDMQTQTINRIVGRSEAEAHDQGYDEVGYNDTNVSPQFVQCHWRDEA